MKCIECGANMEIRRENYRYSPSGLRIVLQNIEVGRCLSCGSVEVAIPRIEDLHGVIAHALFDKPGRLVGQEVRFLRKYLGWSTTDCAEHLGTARETVSRWENNKSPIGPQADRLLRVLAMKGQPVQDYSVDRLTQIGREVSGKRPVSLAMSVGKQGWHAAVA